MFGTERPGAPRRWFADREEGLDVLDGNGHTCTGRTAARCVLLEDVGEDVLPGPDHDHDGGHAAGHRLCRWVGRVA